MPADCNGLHLPYNDFKWHFPSCFHMNFLYVAFVHKPLVNIQLCGFKNNIVTLNNSVQCRGYLFLGKWSLVMLTFDFPCWCLRGKCGFSVKEIYFPLDFSLRSGSYVFLVDLYNPQEICISRWKPMDFNEISWFWRWNLDISMQSADFSGFSGFTIGNLQISCKIHKKLFTWGLGLSSCKRQF